MDLPQKLAFIVQTNRLQGLIWQALLKSQNISAILEAANADLSDCLAQISAAGLALPDLIVLSTETPDLNPYEFCRWCRENFPGIRVFLTRSHIQPLSETEHRWAITQGAAGFFNGFERETLMTNAVASLNQILATVDDSLLDERALLTVLLNIRRQLNPRGSASNSNKPGAQSITAAKGSVSADSRKLVQDQSPDSKSAKASNDLDWIASGLQTLNRIKLGDATQVREASAGSTPQKSQNAAQPPKVDGTSVPGWRS